MSLSPIHFQITLCTSSAHLFYPSTRKTSPNPAVHNTCVWCTQQTMYGWVWGVLCHLDFRGESRERPSPRPLRCVQHGPNKLPGVYMVCMVCSTHQKVYMVCTTHQGVYMVCTTNHVRTGVGRTWPSRFPGRESRASLLWSIEVCPTRPPKNTGSVQHTVSRRFGCGAYLAISISGVRVASASRAVWISNCDQIPLVSPLISTGAHSNLATCGTNQGE